MSEATHQRNPHARRRDAEDDAVARSAAAQAPSEGAFEGDGAFGVEGAGAQVDARPSPWRRAARTWLLMGLPGALVLAMVEVLAFLTGSPFSLAYALAFGALAAVAALCEAAAGEVLVRLREGRSPLGEWSRLPQGWRQLLVYAGYTAPLLVFWAYEAPELGLAFWSPYFVGVCALAVVVTGLAHVLQTTRYGARRASVARTFHERSLLAPARPDAVSPALRDTLRALPLQGRLWESDDGLRFKARIHNGEVGTTRVVLAALEPAEGGTVVRVSSEVRGGDWRDGWLDPHAADDVDHVAAGLGARFPSLADLPRR